MAIDWQNIDFNDPCAIYEALAPTYYQLLEGGGGGTKRVEIEGRVVEFHQSNFKDLSAKMEELRALCKAAGGDVIESSDRKSIRSGFIGPGDSYA